MHSREVADRLHPMQSDHRRQQPATGENIGCRDGLVSGVLLRSGIAAAPLLACIHGGGCNARYFDIKGHSTVEAALRSGFSVLLLNRPGYGANPMLHSQRPVRDGVQPIRAFLDEALRRHLPEARDLLIIGHSIGGATALELAAEPGPLPLRAIAVSGVSDQVDPGVADPVRTDAGAGPDPDLASLFLGDRGTYSWRAVADLRRVIEPWDQREAIEMIHHWPGRWREIAPKIKLPVHLRLADQDRVFATGTEVVARLAAALTGSGAVDAALLPDGGHVYELHRRGPELIGSQIAFLQA